MRVRNAVKKETMELIVRPAEESLQFHQVITLLTVLHPLSAATTA